MDGIRWWHGSKLAVVHNRTEHKTTTRQRQKRTDNGNGRGFRVFCVLAFKIHEQRQHTDRHGRAFTPRHPRKNSHQDTPVVVKPTTNHTFLFVQPKLPLPSCRNNFLSPLTTPPSSQDLYLYLLPFTPTNNAIQPQKRFAVSLGSSRSTHPVGVEKSAA